MMNKKKYFLLLTVFAFALFFPFLNERPFWGSDEPRVAGIAVEMNLHDSWIKPQLNGHSFLEKPPLYFWADALSIKIFGRNYFAAKLPSALAAFAGAILLFFLALSLRLSPFAAFCASVMLCTTAQYWRYGRKCMVDIFLVPFVLLALFAFSELIKKHRHLALKILWFFIFAAGLALAIMSKGPVGLAIPSCALFFTLLFADIFIEKRISWSSWIMLFSGAALSLIPLGLWYWALYATSGYEAFYTAAWVNNIGRFTGSQGDHSEPFYYYLLKLPELFQPWLVLLVLSLICCRERIRRCTAESKELFAMIFALSYLIFPFLLLMLASGKRTVYLLPLYPAAALLSAIFLDDLLHDRISYLRRFKLEKITAFLRSKHCGKYALGLLALAVIIFSVVDVFIYPALKRKNFYDSTFEYCRAFIDNGNDLCLYRPSERVSGGALFFMGRRCREFDDADKLKSFLAKNPRTAALGRQIEAEKISGTTVIKTFPIHHRDLVLFKLGTEK